MNIVHKVKKKTGGRVKATVFEKIRAQEKEGRRKAISAIAEGLLTKKGIDGVTIRNVAEAAGLSTGAIYMYFKNKEELFISILVEHLKNLEQNLVKSMTLGDPAAIFRSMSNDYKTYYLKIGKFIDLFGLMTAAGKGDSNIDKEIMQALRDQLAEIFKCIGNMLGRPEIKKILKGVPPERAVPVLWSMITGLSHVALPSPRASEGGFNFDQVLEDMMKIITG
jgi:AcrR family transcriptional regulator